MKKIGFHPIWVIILGFPTALVIFGLLSSKGAPIWGGTILAGMLLGIVFLSIFLSARKHG